MKQIWDPTVRYAFAHFAVDLGCAYAMFAAYHGSAVGYLLYNFFAFAVQMPVGLLADSWNHNKLLAIIGAALVAVICCLPGFGLLGCVILGLGNSFFHIGGGLDVLNVSQDRAAPLGVFVSPGAFGIYLGTLWGSRAGSPLPILAALGLAALLLLVLPHRVLVSNAAVCLPDRRIWPAAALLFLVVVLRSYGGLSGTFPWKSGLWSLAAVSAVVFGKTLGGFAADRFGMTKAAAASLLLAAGFFIAGQRAVPGLLALLLFNMTMPITLMALAHRMPGCKGFSFGLLTFALFLGFLPTYLGIGTIDSAGMALVTAASALLLLPALLLRKAGRAP